MTHVHYDWEDGEGGWNPNRRDIPTGSTGSTGEDDLRYQDLGRIVSTPEKPSLRYEYKPTEVIEMGVNVLVFMI